MHLDHLHENNTTLNTSMNLNMNPRLEDFLIQDNILLANFLQSLLDEIFKKIKPKALFDANRINDEVYKNL